MSAPPDRDAVARASAILASRPMPGVVSAYAFGSVVENRAHSESDLDVGVLLDRRIYPTERARFEAQLDLRRHLSPALVGREVDLVVLNDAPPLLARRIARGVRIHCDDPALDHAFQRDVQLRAADLEPFIRRMRRRLLARLVR
jgi:predicted nucleotidyltransferase